jgi:hypothetical protein
VDAAVADVGVAGAEAADVAPVGAAVAGAVALAAFRGALAAGRARRTLRSRVDEQEASWPGPTTFDPADLCFLP